MICLLTCQYSGRRRGSKVRSRFTIEANCGYNEYEVAKKAIQSKGDAHA